MGNLIKLPGLIDPHVHLRDMGQEQKEDFYTGTSAALSGGYTTVLDMPNNKVPITNARTLSQKIATAKKKIVCDIGFHFGSLGDNYDEFKKVQNDTFGLKLYLNMTTGKYIFPLEKLLTAFRAWPPNKLILFHAEEDVLPEVIAMVKKTGHKVHVCHVSSKNELSLIIQAKKEGLPITCGVTPHHLFLTADDVQTLHTFGRVKPELMSPIDQQLFWKNFKYIDIIESDHAPHTIEEKESNDFPYGMPGIETTLPLLLTAAADKKITINDIISKCFENPRRIFNITTGEHTYSEVDQDEKWVIENKKLLTKCGWSPFNGWHVKGKVKRVFIRGEKVFEDGKVLVNPGFGRILKPSS